MAHKKRRLNAPGFSTADRFVQLPHYMLKSLAWNALSPEGKAVLIHAWQRHNGQNNGAISYAVREAAEIGLHRNTATRGLAECVELGFLVVTRGSAFSVKTRAARLWRITAERCNSEPPTKDFMRWRPSDSPSAKSKPQSPRRDTQSPQRDRGAEKASISAPTVPPAGLSAPISTPPQSPRRDTSNIPGWVPPAGGAPVPGWALALAARPAGQYADLVARLTTLRRAARGTPEPRHSQKLAAAKSRKSARRATGMAAS